MGNREDLHELLKELLGSTNVYYDPPASITMKYDAIKYSLNDITTKNANDRKYFGMNRYEVIVITKLPDRPIVKSILDLQYCSFDRHYTSDNLHHYVFTLYY